MTEPTAYNWGSTKTADADFFRLSGIDSSLYTVGYAYQEKPAQQDHNTLFRNNYLWQQYLKNRIESQKPQMLYSSGTATWNGSTGALVLSANLDLIFRTYDAVTPNYGEFINRIASGTITLADGECLVVFRDNEGSAGSPSVLSAVAYASLAAGNYAIVASTSLTATNYENETIVFRRRGTNLECVLNGLIYPTGSTISFGQSAVSASTFSGTLAATNGGTGQSTVTTGDLLYGSATNTWSKLAGVATGNVLISGGVGTAPSWGKVGLTTHVSGTLPVANGGTGTTTSTGTGNLVLSASPTFTGTVVIPGCTMSGTWSGAPTMSGNIVFSGSPTFSGDVNFDSGTFYVDAASGRTYFGSTTNTAIGSNSYKRQLVSSSNYFDAKICNDSGPNGVLDVIYHNSGSPTPNDIPYSFGVLGNDDAGNRTTYYQFEVQIDDETNGTEDSSAFISLYKAGTLTSALDIRYDSLKSFSVYPRTGNTYDLGTSLLDWNDIYSVNALTVTSDKRLKEDIKKVSLGLDFICDLEPVSFKWKNSLKKIFYEKEIKKRNGKKEKVKRFKFEQKNKSEKRNHFGFIAQDVEKILKKHNQDFGLVCHDTENDKYLMRTDELIPVLVKSIQQLAEKISNLENQLKH